MPELPEVETIVRYLRPKVRGKRILALYSDTPRIFRDHKNASEVRKKIVGTKIKDLTRVGKNILFRLSHGKCLAVHLMMTGALLWNPPRGITHKRFELLLSGQNRLAFTDVRKFGRCRIISSENQFGNDALLIDFEFFKTILSSRKSAIKNLLLNQKVLAGIGNIYADEILWTASLHPLRKTHTFENNEIRRLYSAMRSVLNLAVKKEGSSVRNYIKPDGNGGGYFEIRKAYQRTGEPCSRCGGVIKRILVGQRSTHFCPKHQV